MPGRTTRRGYTNLLHELALSLTDGRAEAGVRQVPVSGDPYVRVAHEPDFEVMESLRTDVVVALAERGFRRLDPGTMARETPEGTYHVDLGVPAYDAVTHRGFLDMSVAGPYRVPQSGNRANRDLTAERRAFRNAVEERRREMEATLRGMSAMTRLLVASAPFAVDREVALAFERSPDRAVHARIARAFGAQTLRSEADLVEAAGLDAPAPEEAPAPGR